MIVGLMLSCMTFAQSVEYVSLFEVDPTRHNILTTT